MRALSLFALVLMSACGPTQTASYVRGDDVGWLDDPAMSTGLDRRDLDRVFVEQVSDFLHSRFFVGEATTRSGSTIAIVPLANETSEHIDSQLDALASKFETQLVRQQSLTVVSMENHPQIIDQIHREQAPIFDRKTAARFGRLMGVNYVVTGKVFDKAERTDDVRRVQYFVFMQVIAVETGQVMWQGESAVTKALVPNG